MRGKEKGKGQGERQREREGERDKRDCSLAPGKSTTMEDHKSKILCTAQIDQMGLKRKRTKSCVGRERGMDLGRVGERGEYDKTHCMTFSKN